jgi:cell division protein FtsI (penicillin-binding protein 3)
MIERVAPLLGLAPRFEDIRPAGAALRSGEEKRSSL